MSKPNPLSREELAKFSSLLPPEPWPVPNTACEHCGKPVAWISGVGRYVLRHADGDIHCIKPPVLSVSDEDRERAYAEIKRIETQTLAKMPLVRGWTK